VVLACDKPGASFLHSGMFDTDPSPGRVPDIRVPDDISFRRNIELLSVSEPQHPYSVLGGPRSDGLFREAISFFLESLGESGLETSGDMHDMMLLATNLGTLKRVRLALAGIAAGELRNPGEMNIAFAGIEGMAEFDAQFLSASVSELVEKVKGQLFAGVASYEVVLPGLEGHSNLSPFQVADRLDEDGAAEEFAELLWKEIGSGFTHVALPAVLGLTRHAEVMDLLSERLWAKVVEIATVQPSVPGRRMAGTMKRRLEEAGVKLITGRAKGYSGTGKKVEAVRIETRGGDIEIEAGRVVLATGKFIGGGIAHGENITEKVFGLPVYSAGRLLKTGAPVMELMSRKFEDEQPLFSCGVGIDEKLRPLGADGEPAFENVACAGSVIAGYDPYRGRCGTGVAAVTGYIAGTQ